MENEKICMDQRWMYEGMLQDARLWTVWSYCLLRARRQPGYQSIKGRNVKVGAGEFATTLKQMALDLALQRSTIRSILRRLKEQGRIETRSEGKCTVIRIEDWSDFGITAKPQQCIKETR